MLDPERLAVDCSQRATRRGGPGGQHRNKVETAVILTHEPTGILAEASERRSRADNHRVALQRLRVRLALGVRHIASEPTDRWRSRTRGGRIAVSVEHDDFPALLAELLDHWASLDDDWPRLAERLGTSASQLVKLLAREPRALELVNRRRAELGRRPLR